MYSNLSTHISIELIFEFNKKRDYEKMREEQERLKQRQAELERQRQLQLEQMMRNGCNDYNNQRRGSSADGAGSGYSGVDEFAGYRHPNETSNHDDNNNLTATNTDANYPYASSSSRLSFFNNNKNNQNDTNRNNIVNDDNYNQRNSSSNDNHNDNNNTNNHSIDVDSHDIVDIVNNNHNDEACCDREASLEDVFHEQHHSISSFDVTNKFLLHFNFVPKTRTYKQKIS